MIQKPGFRVHGEWPRTGRRQSTFSQFQISVDRNLSDSTPLPSREGLGDFGELSRAEGRSVQWIQRFPTVSLRPESAFRTAQRHQGDKA